MKQNRWKMCSATDWEVETVRSIIQSQQGMVYVEIGSHKGASLKAFGQLMRAGGLVIGIDKSQPAELVKSVIGINAITYLELDCLTIRGDSHATQTRIQLLANLQGRSIDVLFIDGDHSVAGCRKDIEMYSPLVRLGGLMIMHDCGEDHPEIPLSPKVAAIISGLHDLWHHYSKGKNRFMIQQWCGFGGWWK